MNYKHLGQKVMAGAISLSRTIQPPPIEVHRPCSKQMTGDDILLFKMADTKSVADGILSPLKS
jgi:hypothetical protein